MLGLTMAELMVLLLFCVLLVAAAAVARQQTRPTPGNATPLEARDPADLEKPAPAPPDVAQRPGAPRPPDNWRELVLSSSTVASIASAGADPAALAAMPPAEIAAMLREHQALKEAGLARLAPNDLVAAVEAGSGPDAQGHNWPPIITLNDDGYSFKVNSAELTPAFRQRLMTTVTDQVLALIARYHTNVVEVVGHTDEQPITPTRPANLDTLAIEALKGQAPADALVPADNAGLGLARAIAVAHALKSSGRLDDATILPLSAAQLVLPGDVLADGTEGGDNPALRRIEIRVRRTTLPAR